ncbi:MAG: uracil-DNA glycosylase [Candidatus Paceibacterota bacterium]
MKSKTDAMKDVRDKILSLKSSPLYLYRKENNYHPVIGEGNHDAKIMFIGEAPGKSEALSGRPFCGASGKLLDEMLLSIGLPRSEVYITNIVKDRPPENRDPTPEEIELYAPFLDRQIEILEPLVIATLGRHAMNYVMQRYSKEIPEPISKAHGKVYNTVINKKDIVIIPLYHPAAALYNGSQRAVLFEDFKVIKKYI